MAVKMLKPHHNGSEHAEDVIISFLFVYAQKNKEVYFGLDEKILKTSKGVTIVSSLF